MSDIPTVADVAAEAEFQIMVGKEVFEWAAALAGAIHLSYTHDEGRGADALASLAQYLVDTSAGNLQCEIEKFGSIAKDFSAPQKPDAAKRGAPTTEGPAATIGERLALARAWAGLTQAKLAKIAGVEQTSISMLETGDTQRTTYLAELARGCGVSTDWLAFGQEVLV
ncbi:MAG: XRE family transcriptional regulator [Chitinophagaceae bacterium]|nr:MAG: XRE family transcriptional regulator [Chitinophagaceae bacterium]